MTTWRGSNVKKTPVYAVNERPHHTPLALGMVLAYLDAYKGGVLRDHYEILPRLFSSPRALRSEMAKRGPGVLLFSHYVWNTTEMLAISNAVKREVPQALTVHGGPSVPKYDYACDAYMKEHGHVDVAVRSEGEPALAELLERLIDVRPGKLSRGEALADVGNLTFRGDGGEIVRTADRARAVDIAAYPSPYLSGLFDQMGHRWVGAIVETNRGCPYGCTFCDWGSATLQKLRNFPLDRIEAEIDWIGRKRMEVLWLADSNFGILPRDVEIAKMIVAAKRRHGSPGQVAVSFAKNATERVTEIAHLFSEARLCETGILALQSTDGPTLDAIARSNIKTKRYVELRQVFDERNVPVSTDLLLGLPGGTYRAFKGDLQFCFDQRTHAKAYRVVVLPNSPMAHRDYRALHGIEVDATETIVATRTFTREQLGRAERLYDWYLAFVEFSLLKYLLYFLQHEHGVRALDFIEAFADDFEGASDYRFDAVRQVVASMGLAGVAKAGHISYSPTSVFLDWPRFYEEIGAYVVGRYGLPKSSPLDTVLRFQDAIMPSFWRKYPRTEPTAHDVVAYFKKVCDPKRPPEEKVRLADFPPGSVTIEDPWQMRWLPLMFWRLSYGFHRSHFELSTPLSRALFGTSSAPFLFVPEEVTLKNVARSVSNFGLMLVDTFRRVRESAEVGIRRNPFSM